jgi:hypothetical protein
MFQIPRDQFRVESSYQIIMREVGMDAEAVYTHPDVKVWRSIPERENCILDRELASGRKLRLHIKRFNPSRGFTTPADDEALGIRSLILADIPTVKLVGWGRRTDGRSFVITEDLTGYEPADKLLAQGFIFDKIAKPIADLTAKLHSANLHHRDLYLCHFFIRRDPLDVRLIDAARVKQLPGWPMRQRWIIKDLAQLWYSMTQSNIPESEMLHVLESYAHARNLHSIPSLRSKVQSKSNRIAKHDSNLKKSQPDRNISIPM